MLITLKVFGCKRVGCVRVLFRVGRCTHTGARTRAKTHSHRSREAIFFSIVKFINWSHFCVSIIRRVLQRVLQVRSARENSDLSATCFNTLIRRDGWLRIRRIYMTKRGEYRMQTQHFKHEYTPATQWVAQSAAQFQVSSLAEAHAAIFQCFRVRLALLSVVASCGVGTRMNA